MTGPALITGASRGLGHAVAAALGAAGRQVIATARTVGGLEELDDTIRAAGGPRPVLVPLDLAEGEAIARLGAAIAARWGRLDTFIHCAVHTIGLSPAGHVEAKDFDRAMAVNARALLHLVAALDPLLRAAQGQAVICDDRASGRFYAAHAATKAAAREIARSWAEETARTGPRVALFTPPPMPTACRARFFPGEDRAPLTPCAEVAAQLIATLGPA
jgi:NAD(P)-dependent dehydrogenase (short-subunit alcohol dehydrogenase family)